MLTYTQDTIRKDAIVHAKRANNTIDCDVIAAAYFKLEAMNIGSEPQDVLDGLEYLLTAIAYRTERNSMPVMYAKSHIEKFTASMSHTSTTIQCANCKNCINNYNKSCPICSVENKDYKPRMSLLEAIETGDKQEVDQIMRDAEDGMLVRII